MSRSVKKKASHKITSIISIFQSYQILMLVLIAIFCKEKENSNTNQTENEQLSMSIANSSHNNTARSLICKTMQCMIEDLILTQSNTIVVMIAVIIIVIQAITVMEQSAYTCGIPASNHNLIQLLAYLSMERK